MNRNAFVRCTSIAAAALMLAAGAGAAVPGLLPAQAGDSVLYQYDVDGVHPSTGQVWVVRSNATRLSVTVSPSADAPGTFAFDVDATGRVRAAGNESPVEPSAVAMEMSRNFASAINLLAPAATSAAPNARWSIEVPAPGEGSVVTLSARVATSEGNQRTAVADGAGVLTLPSGPPDRRGRLPAPVVADVTMHIEALMQTGALANARGTVVVISREKQPKKTQYTWSIAMSGR